MDGHGDHVRALDRQFDHHHQKALDALRSWKQSGDDDDYDAYEHHVKMASMLTSVIDRCAQHGI